MNAWFWVGITVLLVLILIGRRGVTKQTMGRLILVAYIVLAVLGALLYNYIHRNDPEPEQVPVRTVANCMVDEMEKSLRDISIYLHQGNWEEAEHLAANGYDFAYDSCSSDDYLGPEPAQ